MSSWVVETTSFEEDIINNRVVMLNQNGINKVVEIIKKKDKEIERLKKIIDKIELALELNIEELEEYQLSKDRIDEDKNILRYIKELKENLEND